MHLATSTTAVLWKWWVTQSSLTLCNSMDCSPPGSSVHGILQAKILECVAILSSRGSSWPKDQTHISHIDRWKFFPTVLPGKPQNVPESYCFSNGAQFSSVTQSCPTLCDPMNHSMPGLPVRHQLPEFTQTHVHQVSDAIQPSHPLSSPSPPAPNSSQNQGLFKWVSASHEVDKVLEFQL